MDGWIQDEEMHPTLRGASPSSSSVPPLSPSWGIQNWTGNEAINRLVLVWGGGGHVGLQVMGLSPSSLLQTWLYWHLSQDLAPGLKRWAQILTKVSVSSAFQVHFSGQLRWP